MDDASVPMLLLIVSHIVVYFDDKKHCRSPLLFLLMPPLLKAYPVHTYHSRPEQMPQAILDHSVFSWPLQAHTDWHSQ